MDIGQYLISAIIIFGLPLFCSLLINREFSYPVFMGSMAIVISILAWQQIIPKWMILGAIVVVMVLFIQEIKSVIPVNVGSDGL